MLGLGDVDVGFHVGMPTVWGDEFHYYVRQRQNTVVVFFFVHFVVESAPSFC